MDLKDLSKAFKNAFKAITGHFKIGDSPKGPLEIGDSLFLSSAAQKTHKHLFFKGVSWKIP